MMSPICKRNLSEDGGVLKSRSWDNITMICIDIVSFTQTSSGMCSADVCKLLGKFYSRVDKLSIKWNVDKIDIIGDAYIAVSQFADDAVGFCLAALNIAKHTFWDNNIPSLGVLHLRCAVHTGKVTGLVLDSIPFKYTLVGETVVKAKSLEALAPPGHVNCSGTTAKCLDDKRFRLVSLMDEPECYLVQNAVDVENTVVERRSMKFHSVSNDFVRIFGFERVELRSLRPVFGPRTRLDAIHMAMDLCVEQSYPASIPVVLYSRTAVEVRALLEFRRMDNDDLDSTDDCVTMRCVVLVEDV